MRYVAENLSGALLETMARFRPAPEAEALLAAFDGVDPDDDPGLLRDSTSTRWSAGPLRRAGWAPH